MKLSQLWVILSGVWIAPIPLESGSWKANWIMGGIFAVLGVVAALFEGHKHDHHD